MSAIREPSVAGTFYPADPEQLSGMIVMMLQNVSGDNYRNTAPKAIIAPHAGYMYSGPIAASVYAHLAHAISKPKKVVLLGPAHRYSFHGIAASSASHFLTPLGTIAVAEDKMDGALALPFVHQIDDAFDGEHSLEVHLPFLLEVLDDFSIMPFLVGNADPKDIAALLELLWGDDDTVIVISSDLSHYYPYDQAKSLDQVTTSAIETLNPDNIGDEGACGRLPIKGLLIAAKKYGLQATTLDLRNSGDTSGDKDRVVGYGAYVFR